MAATPGQERAGVYFLIAAFAFAVLVALALRWLIRRQVGRRLALASELRVNETERGMRPSSAAHLESLQLRAQQRASRPAGLGVNRAPGVGDEELPSYQAAGKDARVLMEVLPAPPPPALVRVDSRPPEYQV